MPPIFPFGGYIINLYYFFFYLFYYHDCTFNFIACKAMGYTIIYFMDAFYLNFHLFLYLFSFISICYHKGKKLYIIVFLIYSSGYNILLFFVLHLNLSVAAGLSLSFITYIIMAFILLLVIS